MACTYCMSVAVSCTLYLVLVGGIRVTRAMPDSTMCVQCLRCGVLQSSFYVNKVSITQVGPLLNNLQYVLIWGDSGILDKDSLLGIIWLTEDALLPVNGLLGLIWSSAATLRHFGFVTHHSSLQRQKKKHHVINCSHEMNYMNNMCIQYTPLFLQASIINVNNAAVLRKFKQWNRASTVKQTKRCQKVFSGHR